MPIKPLSLRYGPALFIAAGGLLAGLGGVASANAASGAQITAIPAVTQQAAGSQLSSPWIKSIIRVTDNDGDNNKSGSSSKMKEKKANRTNQTTGAADTNPGSMSEQKGNQPKSAVKTN